MLVGCWLLFVFGVFFGLFIVGFLFTFVYLLCGIFVLLFVCFLVVWDILPGVLLCSFLFCLCYYE